MIMILAKIGVSRTSVTYVNSFPQKVDVPSPQEEKDSSPAYSYEFANEVIPVERLKVFRRMNKYLKANSYEHIQTDRLHHQAARWFPIMEPILKRYGIPDDFKYLPLVESGLKRGTSVKGAAGYWQFMPGTARSYGLIVNGDVDERHNMKMSTAAACRYLKELHNEFHNWTLVAAAYNLGENKLRKRINTQGHKSYFKLKLNNETASYVYKLVSMKEVIENPIKYGFASRNKELLAKETRPEPVYINPVIEQNAISALNLLQKQEL
ncbi:Membrane-bound lytic murein transglycosylase D precursor [Arcticibacter svalbardensis MN12-7]|uniref:Membrane-bound lytic murein transglycosylase D n=2 Tax=Arcticibacter TaxID=1288026 RepID=R9GM60_9SPHI|nr:Membrane-bound lytic murein transglycosylase D precursor [Arcticibacter svalbardensis MN12-7]